jgi:hypothetical protein
MSADRTNLIDSRLEEMFSLLSRRHRTSSHNLRQPLTVSGSAGAAND